eukprot:TRINITY_DN2109_c0_g1_i1.p1 TRINITY_DN2109_c0_g1~~TRINITY_DN2109_c0_g1_i1.p1  ORF type:complete len:111 (-),score=5.42 TRINITY_DN2109_c0_g1_i1:73-405(-)
MSAHQISNKAHPIGIIFMKNCFVSQLFRFGPPSDDTNQYSNDKIAHFYDDMDREEKKIYKNLETQEYSSFWTQKFGCGKGTIMRMATDTNFSSLLIHRKCKTCLKHCKRD